MNYSRAVFLINDNVRGALVIYENEEEVKNPKRELKKTFDHSLREGDYVVVPTTTRHRMTVVKIVGFVDNLDVDVKDDEKVDWIIGRVELADYQKILTEEERAIQAIKSATKRREREELKKALMADAAESIKALPIASEGDIEEPTTTPQA